jgi:hypothetical protein
MVVHKIKYFLGGVIAAVLLIAMAACETQPAAASFENSTSLQAQFVMVYDSYGYSIVYNAANRVMYAVSSGPSNAGTFTLLVNDDGSPMIWKG